MNLYLEPLMTGLPKLSCYHRAYYEDSGNLVIDLGSRLIPKNRQVFFKEIISGTSGIFPEVSFRIFETTSAVTDSVIKRMPEEGKLYRFSSHDSGIAVPRYEYRTSDTITSNYSTMTIGKSIQGVNSMRLVGRSTRVSDEDLEKVRSLIMECLTWRESHHVTAWQ